MILDSSTFRECLDLSFPHRNQQISRLNLPGFDRIHRNDGRAVDNKLRRQLRRSAQFEPAAFTCAPGAIHAASSTELLTDL